MAQATARVPDGCGTRADRRQLRRTLALRPPCGNFFLGAACGRRLLGRSVGTRGPDPIYASDGLRRGSGALGRDTFDLDIVVDSSPRDAARAIARAAGGAACFELSEEFSGWRVIARERTWLVDGPGAPRLAL